MLTSLPLGICYIINPCAPERVKRVFAAYDGRASVLTRSSLCLSPRGLCGCVLKCHTRFCQEQQRRLLRTYLYSGWIQTSTSTLRQERLLNTEMWTTLADEDG